MSFGPFRTLDQILAVVWAIYDQGKLIMSALDDVKAADAKLGVSISKAIAILAADAAALVAAHSAPDNTADLETLAKSLSDKAAALDEAVNPPPGADSVTGATS